MDANRGSWSCAAHQPHAVSPRIGADATAEIIRRYGSEETVKSLAEEFGVARSSVLNLLRDHNVDVRRQPPDANQRSRLVREYDAGDTIAELVTRHGRSYGAIREALKSAGAQMRPRGGGANRH